MGHLEGAAGIASVIKTVLCLQHQQIVKTLHHHKTNPKIHLDETNIFIADTPISWSGINNKRIAAISSFGATGTNAHVILEEGFASREPDMATPLPKQQLFVLSAKSQKSMEALIASYIQYLEQSNERIEDICYTAAIGRIMVFIASP